MIRFRLLAPAVFAAVVMLSGSALAYVCHPMAPGTRTLTLSGSVQSVLVHGTKAEFLVGDARSCSRVAWSTADGTTTSSRAATCTSRSTQAARLAVAVDRRGRPVLVEGNRAVPLPAFARSATVADGIALVEATHPDSGVFAVRLRDGAFTYLGPEGHGFAPYIDSRGALFHDGESKRLLAAGKTVAMYVPRQNIVRGFRKTIQPLVTGGAIRGFSMDGLRVAVAVADRARHCDRVLYWNVAWRPVQRISAPSGPTCVAMGQTHIDTVSNGGFRAEWLATSRDGVRLIAGSPRCQEWVIRRLAAGQRLAAVAGNGATLAYATTAHDSSIVGVVSNRWRARQIGTGRGAVLALAADRAHVAALWRDGTVRVWTVRGALIARLHVGAARALAIERDRLAVLRGRQLVLYNLTGSRSIRSFSVPGATGVDLQYGIAAFRRGREAVILDTATGRTAVVGRAPRTLLGVQIEGPGLAYSWTSARRGFARFVPTIQLDRALQR